LAFGHQQELAAKSVTHKTIDDEIHAGVENAHRMGHVAQTNDPKWRNKVEGGEDLLYVLLTNDSLLVV